MGLFSFILGWKKLLDINISFGDSNWVSVACDTNSVDVPGTEYIRLWLQYTAHVFYLLGRVGKDYSEELLGVLDVLGNERITPDTNVFPIITDNEALLYSEIIEDPEVVIKGKYYVKGSASRMVNIGTYKPELMRKSVSALFQFAISKNRRDQDSLNTLFHAARLFVEYYESMDHESADSMAQLPLQVLIAAVSKAHVSESDA